MKNGQATATATATAPIAAIREVIELLIDIRGIEVTRFGPVKTTVAWLEAAEREGKGK